MKKRLVFVAIISLALGLICGCKEKETPPSGGDNPPVVNPPVTHTHSWGSWTEEKKATCTEAGKKTRKCSGCDEVQNEDIPALNHNFKDGYCTRCKEADPKDTTMIEGKEFQSVSISEDGVLTFSRLKCASKYVLTISPANQEKKTVELDKTKGSYSLKELPVGRTMVTLTAYENVEIKVDNETHYQEVPISTATDEFRITKVNNTFTLVRLKYTDEYITLEGFYDTPRVDSQSKENYYLYETVYKAPSLSNIMNNSHIKDAKNFKLKDSSKYKLVYYESDGKTSFVLGGNHYMNVARAAFMKYYIAVVEKDTNVEVKRYPIKTYGLTTAEIEFKLLSITEENGIRQVETTNLLDESISMIEGDILSNEIIYSSVQQGLLARTSTYTMIQRNEDLIVPTSDASNKVNIYFYEESLVKQDCKEYEEYSKDYVLSESEYGWSLNAITKDKDITIPAYIIGKPVVSARFYSSPLETLTLSEGISMWIVDLSDCANIEKIILPSTITYMERQSFNGVRRDCKIYCNFTKSKGDSFVTNWNQIVGSLYSYTTYYIDTPIIQDGCQVEIVDEKGVITGYTDSFTGAMPSTISFGTTEYPIIRIADSAFYSCEVSQMILPESLEEIGSSAFENCVNLASISLPQGLVEIGDSAFYNCFNLLEVYNLSSLELSIGSQEFGYVVYYAKVIHKEESSSNLIEQDGYRFYKENEETYYLVGCTKTEEEVILPKEIQGHSYTIATSAFKECNFLAGIFISDGVKEIEENAFKDCNLEKIYYEGTIEDWCQSNFNGKQFVSNSSDTNLYLKNENNEWNAVENLIIPQTIQEVKEYKFYGFKALSSLTIPGHVEFIGNGTFENCYSLNSLVLSKNLSQLGNEVFKGCPITHLYYEGTIEDWCNNTLTGKDFFKENNTNHFFLKNGNAWEEVTSLEIPETITELQAYAFNNFTSISSVVIPDTIEIIGEKAFYNCKNITIASAPTSAISYIPKDKLKEFIVTSGDTVSHFSNCKTLQKVTICEGITSLGDYAFADCTGLESLILPESLETISSSAFQMSYGYSNAMFNEYENGLYLGSEEHPYLWLIKAKNIYITYCNVHEETKYIYYQALRECSNLTSLTIGSNVIRIEDEAIYWCNRLTSIVLPDSVTSIGTNAFWNCNGLISIVLPSQIQSIGADAFSVCISLKKVYYKGTFDDWNSVSIDKGNQLLTQSTIYFYSETQPLEGGNYWHFVDGYPKEW